MSIWSVVNKNIEDRLRKFFVTHPPEREMPRQPYDPGAAPTWFGNFINPGFPIAPVGMGQPDSETGVRSAADPRYFDYQAGVNANVIPRTEYPMVPNFMQLWAAYLSMPLLRVMVTFRSNEILSLDWKVKLRDGSGSRLQTGVSSARKLLEKPDPQMDYGFEQWCRSIIEEINVTDALTLYPQRNSLGRVVGFMQVDGQTIKPLIDYIHGGIPAPPDPAYVQYIKGTSFTQFTSEEIVYRPFRPRVWCVYGQSRVENILAAATLYQMHEEWTGDWFTRGNIPEVAAIVDSQMASSMPASKWKEWQQALDETSGFNAGRRRIHLMPPIVKDVRPLKEFSFDRTLPDWMVRFACIEWGVPSYLFTAETNRATAKEMNETIHDAPLRGDLMILKRLFDKLLECAGYEECEFEWQKQPDYSLDQVNGVISMVGGGANTGIQVMTIAEARQYFGMSQNDELDQQGEEDTEVDDPEATPDPGPPEDTTAPQGTAPGGEGLSLPPVPKALVAGKPSGSAGLPPVPKSLTEEQPAAHGHGLPPVPKSLVSEGPKEKFPAVPDSLAPAKSSGFPPMPKTLTTKTVKKPRFKGPNADARVVLATGLARVIQKRMAQQRAIIMQEAVARARKRGKKIKGE